MKLDRLNVIILILFPIFALGAIKVTNSILPAKYYFSISKLAKGADEPFIVEPPSVTQRKFCDLLKKYRVEPSQVNLPHVECGRIYADQQTEGFTRFQPTPQEKDQIYRIAFQTDQGARDHLFQDVRARALPILTDEELDTLLQKASSPLAAFQAISRHYAYPYDSIRYSPDSRLAGYFKNAFAPIENAHASNQPGNTNYAANDGYKPSDLTPEEIAKIKAAHQRFANDVVKINLGEHYRTASVDDIEGIIAGVYSTDDIARGFTNFYVDQIAPVFQAALRTAFEEGKLDLSDTDKLRKDILTEASQTGIFGYIIAALARVMPIFVVALLFGAYFGRREVFSISVGAAALAFLLVWPILLLWDTVVQSQWAEYKTLFVGLYLLYVVTFFAVARSGGLIGAATARGLGLRQTLDEAGGAIDTSGRVNFREIVVSLISSGIFSFFAFSLNLIVPLQA